MSDERKVHNHLITGGGIFLVIAGLVFWASNPDEESFQRHFRRHSVNESDGLGQAIAARLVSEVVLELGDWEYTTYGFFSIARNEDFNFHYLGMLGRWERVQPDN